VQHEVFDAEYFYGDRAVAVVTIEIYFHTRLEAVGTECMVTDCCTFCRLISVQSFRLRSNYVSIVTSFYGSCQ